MNQDTVWQIIRYALIAGGGFFAGKGYITQEQLQAVIGFAAVVVPAAWGLWVKWNTSPVLDKIVEARNVPVVNSATGTGGSK